jgi:hypothetical protein
MNTMEDDPVIRCALDEKRGAVDAGLTAQLPSEAFSDPPFLSPGSSQVCQDPPIWIFDDLLSDSLLARVDSAFDGIKTQPLNGREVRMVELNIDEHFVELTHTLRDISYITDEASCGKAWVMDVKGRNQGPHMDGWELEKHRESMQLLDLSKCSVQCHNGFNTIIPTLSIIVYFNDSGGCAFPRAALPNPVIPARRGRILMFQNYNDVHRPAHNPNAVHYGVYGDGFKRVMTAGVMSSETPVQLSGYSAAGTRRTQGFLYAPIMHRANTSCGTPSPPTPPPPKPKPKPKPKPVLNLFVRSTASPSEVIVEASNLAGDVVAKTMIEKDATLGQLRASLAVDADLVCKEEILREADSISIRDTALLQDIESGKAEVEQQVETLVEWDVIDTVFVKKEVSSSSSPKESL